MALEYFPRPLKVWRALSSGYTTLAPQCSCPPLAGRYELVTDPTRVRLAHDKGTSGLVGSWETQKRSWIAKTTPVKTWTGILTLL